MNPRRFSAALTALLCRNDVLPAFIVVGLAALGAAGMESAGSPLKVGGVAPSLAANASFAERPDGKENPGVAIDAAIASQSASVALAPTVPLPPESEWVVEAALTDPAEQIASDATPSTAREPEAVVEALPAKSEERLPSEALLEQATTAAASAAAPHAEPGETQTASSVEVFDECFVVEICVDRYLWSLYQRTPKEDSVKMTEKSQVTVKRKGKMVTVTRTSSRIVDEDFAWKDPKAADKANMEMMNYVIGGMDPTFKLKLFHVLHAAEAAGLVPGITSAFRDDYRQSIASGLKAATDRSFHGGSFRGGYGHGLAADIVSVKGTTRSQRQASSEMLWQWVDKHGREYGVGRPYLDRDPPHVGPTDGQEYVSRRGTGGGKTRLAAAAEKHKRVAAATAR